MAVKGYGILFNKDNWKNELKIKLFIVLNYINNWHFHNVLLFSKFINLKMEPKNYVKNQK